MACTRTERAMGSCFFSWSSGAELTSPDQRYRSGIIILTWPPRGGLVPSLNCPPSSRVKRWTMARPSPVPPCFPVAKGRMPVASSSSLKPGPSSVTVMATRCSFSCLIAIRMSPGRAPMAWAALSIRLSKHWRMRLSGS